MLPGQGRYYSPQFDTAEGRVTEPGYVADVITDKALRWLEERDQDRPFMLLDGAAQVASSRMVA